MKTALRISKKDKTTFNALKFLDRAISSDETRWFMQRLYVAGSLAVATDGHRMHTLERDLDLEPGLYFVDIGKEAATLIADTETALDNYPKFQRILKAARAMKKVATIDLSYVNVYRNSVGLGEVFHLTGRTIQLAYLRDICGHEWAMYADLENEHSQVRFVAEGGLEAIIMPMVRD